MPLDRRDVRVGLLVIIALATLAAGIFLIGERSNLFQRTNTYLVRLANVTGLQAGNPVQLSGVDVGRVEEIILPQDPDESLLDVRISIDKRYARRVRKDSRASVKTLGLLGDKYILITSGSGEAVVIPSGGEIEAAAPTDVDELIASGEDVVENILAMSVTLKRLLDRIESGEGVLGELLVDSPDGAGGSIRTSLASLEAITASLEAGIAEGQGPLGRLLYDEAMGDRLAGSLDRLEALLASAQEGDGLMPALLNDPEMPERVETLLASLQATSDNLASFTATLEEGDGLLPKLINDEAYAEKVSGELEELLERLNATTEEIVEGDGTVGMLIRDPAIYEALNDILVGINESKILRWLIRNRQKKGIKVRYEDAQEALEEDAADEAPPGSEPS